MPVRSAGAMVNSFQGLNEEEPHQERAQHVDAERRVGKIAAIDGLHQIGHGIARPAAERAADGNGNIGQHNPPCPLIAHSEQRQSENDDKQKPDQTEIKLRCPD